MLCPPPPTFPRWLSLLSHEATILRFLCVFPSVSSERSFRPTSTCLSFCTNRSGSDNRWAFLCSIGPSWGRVRGTAALPQGSPSPVRRTPLAQLLCTSAFLCFLCYYKE